MATGAFGGDRGTSGAGGYGGAGTGSRGGSTGGARGAFGGARGTVGAGGYGGFGGGLSGRAGGGFRGGGPTGAGGYGPGYGNSGGGMGIGGAGSGTTLGLGHTAYNLAKQMEDSEETDFWGHLAGLFGGYEAPNPWSAYDGTQTATWGMDPAGMIGGAIGLATGLPFLGTATGLASKFAGHPLGISFDSRMNAQKMAGLGGGGGAGPGAPGGNRGMDPRQSLPGGMTGMMGTQARPAPSAGGLLPPPAGGMLPPGQPPLTSYTGMMPSYNVNTRFGNANMGAYQYG